MRRKPTRKHRANNAVSGGVYGILLALVFASGCATSNPEVHSIQATFTTIDASLAPDPTVEHLVSGYEKQLAAQMNEVIGVASVDLNNHSGGVESVLGNFVADLMLETSEDLFGAPLHFSIINTRGGLRVPISKGPITVGGVYELMPFDNDVWILELTGEETIQLFEHCARTQRMALGGATYEIAQGAQNIRIAKSPLDPDQTYLAAIPDYLATGGDNFDFLIGANVVEELGYLVRDMIIDHIRDLNQESRLVEGHLDRRVITLP